MRTSFRLLVICLVTLCGFSRAFAQPQLPDYAPTVRGHVRYLDGKTKTPAPLPAAKIEVWLKMVLVMETRSDDDGAFVLNQLPIPATSSDGFVVVARPSKQDADLGVAATDFVLPAPAGEVPNQRATKVVPEVELTLELARTRRIRVVALSDKKPLEGARLSVLKFNVSRPGGGNWPLPAYEIKSQNSDAQGIVDLAGVPKGALAELQVRRDGYADNIVLLKNTETDATIALALESRVYGRVTLDGEEPLDVPQWRIKMQGWNEPWRSHWRVAFLNARGEFVISNVPPPALTGEAAYSINLDLTGVPDPRPGLHAEYVPPQAGWDVMVTRQRDGQTRRYISYVLGPENGLVFPENSELRHDFNLEPMALLVGKTVPGATLFYRNPRSIYGGWRQQADENGDFEVPVPTGDVRFQLNGQWIEVKDLKAHETREVLEPQQTEKRAETQPKLAN